MGELIHKLSPQNIEPFFKNSNHFKIFERLPTAHISKFAAMSKMVPQKRHGYSLLTFINYVEETNTDYQRRQCATLISKLQPTCLKEEPKRKNQRNEYRFTVNGAIDLINSLLESGLVSRSLHSP